MTEDHPSIDEMFDEARRRAPGKDRAAYLEEVCGDDTERRQRVERLLRAFAEAASFLESPAADASPTSDPPIIVEPGMEIGPYKLREQIGEGGFGIVFVAEQQLPLRRKVAIKVIKPGMDSRDVIARFEAERQALALMDHPNIAKVLDAGTTESGRPYFVMELVKGITIVEYCDGQKVDTRERLKLFVSVCQAVQHAHGKGVIHRDLKPSNIMVAPHDGVPVVKVIDFGVAKAIGQRLTDKTVYTRFAQMIGTPLYMSPEQAEINALDVDTRCDVYSLGVLLYELLTGTTPFDRERFARAALDEMRRIIKQEEPPKPSTRVSSLGAVLTTISANRGIEPTNLSKLIRGDLDWIVMKALEKDRQRRYETAHGLSMDVQRYLNDEPIVARPPSTAYRLSKMVQRNKVACVTTVAVFASLLVGLFVAAWGLVEANRQRGIAQTERKIAVRERDVAHRARNDAVQKRLRAEKAEEQGRHRLVRLTIANGMRHLEAGDLLSSLPWFTEALRLDHADLAREQLHRMRLRSALQQCPKLVWMWYHEGPVTFQTGTLELKLATNAEFSPDGRFVVAPSGNMTARVWDTATGRVVHVLTHSLPVLHACFSRDGRRIATASGDLGGGHEGFAFVWDAGTGERITPPLVHDDAAIRASFSPNGNRLVTGSLDKTARVWDVGTSQPITPPMKHDDRVIAVSFSPDGRRVVTAAEFQNARIWDSVTGQPRTPSVEGYRHASFSPDGSRVVTAGSGARVWDTDSGELVATLAPRAPVWHASFSPDGQLIVTASHDRTAQVWEVATGNPVGAPLRHLSGVTQARFSPDSRHVVTGSWDRTARVWEASTGRPVTLPLKHGGDVMCAAFSPDGHRIVTSSTDLLVRVWDLANLKGNTRPLYHSGTVNWAGFSRDGQRVVTASADGSARVWDTVTGEPVTPPLEYSGAVRYAAFSPDGQRVLTTNDDGTARVWDATNGEPTGALLKHGNRPVVHGSFSPDGGSVATASEEGTARVWDVNTGKKIATFHHRGPVYVAWFSPDGHHVLTCSHDATARVWHAATAESTIPPLKHKSAVLYASFSGDGLRVLTTSSDGTARVWDASNGQPTGAPIWHGQEVSHGSFSPDARQVVTASNDNTARVWDAATGEPLTPPLGWHPSNPYCASFSADGRLIVTAWGEGVARVWDAVTGEPLTGALRHGHVHAEFSPAGYCLLTASTDGTARLWDLLPDDRPVEDLMTLAQVLCGHRIDATGASLEPVEAGALLEAWRKLRDGYPDDFVTSPNDLFAWHREEADACERLGRWSDAIGHLETAQQYSSDSSNPTQYRETLARLKRLRAEAEELTVAQPAEKPPGDDR